MIIAESVRFAFYFIRRFFFIPAFILLFAGLVSSEEGMGTLTGQVKDEDGAALPGVTVSAIGEKATKTVYTDSAGNFAFTSLTPGLYDIGAELAGFISITKTDIEIKAGANEISFVLSPGGLAELMVVTASKIETPLINAPATLSVVRSDNIASSPAQNYGDLLRSVPGLNVTQTSNRDINLTSRQANSTLATSQLALLDGRTIYLDFFGFIGWDFLPVNFDEIKQVEVIRGPASAVWGANAQTGVVNILTKSPRETPGVALTLTGGFFNRDVEGAPSADNGSSFGANVRFAQAVNETWSYKLSAGYFNSDPWARPVGIIPRYIYPPGEKRPVPATNPALCLIPGTTCTGGTPYSLATYQNQETSQPKFDVRVDQELSSDSRISYSGGVAGTDGIIHTGIGPFDIQSGTVLGYGRVAYNKGNMKLNFFANFLDGDAINQFGATSVTGKPVDLIFKNQTYDIEFGNSNVLGEKNVLTYGGNYRRNNFELSIAPNSEDRNEFGGYIQDEFYTDKFRLVLGARLDKFSVIDDPVFSPRVTAMFKPAPDHSIRASFNKAFRSPSAINNYLDTVIVNALNLGLLNPALNGILFLFPTAAKGNEPLNAKLKEESLTAYEVGYTGEFNGKTTVGISYYINDSNDNINFTLPPGGNYTTLPPGSACRLGATGPFIPCPIDLTPLIQAGLLKLPALFTYLNLGPLRQQGVELSLDQIVNSWSSFYVNYSYQKDPEILEADPGQIPYPIIEVIWPPHHRFNAGVNFNSRRWLGNFSVAYQGDAFWTDVLDSRFFGPTDAFTQVNGSFGVKWLDGRVTTTIKVTNLFNEEILQHVFGDIQKRSIVGEAKFNW